MRLSRQRASITLALLLLIAAFMIMLLGLFAPNGPAQLWATRFGPPQDGSWLAVNLDGKPASAKNYSIAVRGGRVIGGYDDCNGWAYEDEGPDRNGVRKSISTLVLCSNDELRRTYRILVYAPRLELLARNDLRLTRDGHYGLFRRCRPDRERFRCVPI